MNDLHCNYLTARLDALDPATSITFRVGMPTDWDSAIHFHQVVDGALAKRQTVKVRYGDAYYRVAFSEVRGVDDHGGGLGSERHRSRRYASEVYLEGQERAILPPCVQALTWAEVVAIVGGV